MRHSILILLVVAYTTYGVQRFSGLLLSSRYVKERPRYGMWGPGHFFRSDTWTEERLRQRNRMLLWEAGLLVLLVIVGVLL